MTGLRSQRGTTLLEAVIAMALLVLGGVGLLGLHRQQLAMNGEARRTTTAVALARDLVENMAGWRYDDVRLANARTANDADIGDTAQAFETAGGFTFDHDEASLGAWTGLPARQGFERYWNVAYVDDLDGNGIPDAVRIAVIVRWQTDVGWRRVVLLSSKANPREAIQ